MMTDLRGPKFNEALAGRTLLMRAVYEGNLEMVVALLQEGSDVNAQDSDGDTALMFAAFKGDFLCVKLLLAHGADVHARARNGWTAKRAAQSKNFSDVTALLERAEDKAFASGILKLEEEFFGERED